MSEKKGGHKFLHKEAEKEAEGKGPTPPQLYHVLVKELHYKDVCQNPKKFNALTRIWPNHSYCSPPWSEKAKFVDAAIRSNEAGHEVLLYLPFDPSANWFHKLYEHNPLIVFFLIPPGHIRGTAVLIDLDFYSGPEVVFIWKLEELKDVLPPAPHIL